MIRVPPVPRDEVKGSFARRRAAALRKAAEVGT